MPALPPNEDLVSLIAGEVDVATLASRHGVSEETVQQWRSAFLAGMKASAAGRSVSRRSRHRLVIAAVAVLATAASAQLALFTPDTPARASAVNGNFAQLKTWLEAKVGTVGSGAGGNSDITTGTISTTGAATVGGAANFRGAANFGATTRQMINLWNADYGIGIQSSTEYFRTGANFAWYKGGAHNDATYNSGGGSTLMTLDGTGVIRGPTYGFGGMYTTNGVAPSGASGVCGYGAAASYAMNNPITGAQSCPTGFTAVAIFILDYCWPNVGAQRATTYMCWK